MTEITPDSTPAQREESARLAEVTRCLQRALQAANTRLQHYARDIQEQKTYLWEMRDEMDHIEKIAARESIEQAVRSGDVVLTRKKQLLKLLQSPYFGRFDVARAGASDPEPVYIGIHHFQDDADQENVVYDWRAPIATLFYDFETGPARYASPKGEVECEIRLKRQFRIRHGAIERMIDSSVNVVDDVLQEELSRASDENMRNIVATIQRDQNAIIRDDQAPELIIQGVAGSGKTSIALHRIAFLLYRFKDTLSSEDILIISPNRVFADYIANVLPELGEETVNEIGMEAVADELLGGQYRFQTFFEQTAALLDSDDEEMRRRLRFKASPDLLKKLNQYTEHVENTQFTGEDVWVARRLVPGWLLKEIYQRHRGMPPGERINRVVADAEHKIAHEYRYELSPDQRKELKAAIEAMVRQSTLRETYRNFYAWLGDPALFRTARHGKLEYADVFPLIYLKMQLEGIRSPYGKVKHLLIDEMQDYTPVQYAVIARLFKCRKTILGDAHQAVNPFNASRAEDIRKVFWQARSVTLNKSYRSSYEITQFAQRISPNPDLIAIERHGEAPEVIRCKTRREELDTLRRLLADFADSPHNAVGILCRTQKQAQRIFEALDADNVPDLHLLTAQSHSLGRGVIVCTAHMAKGLEFDQVIVPEVNDTNYRTAMDRNLLYVACTRAMHKLTLTHTGTVTSFF